MTLRLLPAALVVAPLCGVLTAQPRARHVDVTEDTVVELSARVRITTVIVVPEDERILTFVTGDSEYWGLEGAANVALLKPMAEGVETNVALITDAGNIYSLMARESGGQPPPDLKVYLHRVSTTVDPESLQRAGTPLEAPRFVASSELDDYREQARLARDQAREAHAAAQEIVDRGIDDFRSAYPGTLRFDYRLPAEAAGPPWRVRGMWHDQRFTYLLSDAAEAPALYELKDGKPSLVAYDFTDGLYIARHVLEGGWLQVGKRQLRWRWDPPRELP